MNQRMCPENAPDGYVYNHNENCYQKKTPEKLQTALNNIVNGTVDKGTVDDILDFEEPTVDNKKEPDIVHNLRRLKEQENLLLSLDELLNLYQLVNYDTHPERFLREAKRRGDIKEKNTS